MAKHGKVPFVCRIRPKQRPQSRIIYQRVLTTKPLKKQGFGRLHPLFTYVLYSVTHFYKENNWFNTAVSYNFSQKIFPAYIANILLRATLEQFSIPFNKLPLHGALQTSDVTLAFIQKGLTYRYNLEGAIKELWSFKSTLL